MKSALLLLSFYLVPSIAVAQYTLLPQHTDSVKGKKTYSIVDPSAQRKYGSVIPGNYYTQHFGYFCRQELKLQQANIPVIFRLGSVEYCDWMEQKKSRAGLLIAR